MNEIENDTDADADNLMTTIRSRAVTLMTITKAITITTVMITQVSHGL